MGHEDRFPLSRLSARCGFSKKTFAGTRGNEEDAPKNEPARAGKSTRRGWRNFDEMMRGSA
jgi:hypothetical protein